MEDDFDEIDQIESWTDQAEGEDDVSQSAATTPDMKSEMLSAMASVDADAASALEGQWGDQFEENIELAREAMKTIASPPLVALIDKAGLGDHPELIRAAADIGRLVRDSSVSQNEFSLQQQPALEKELNQLREGDDYWSEKSQKRVREIFLSLYGSQQMVPHREFGDASRQR